MRFVAAEDVRANLDSPSPVDSLREILREAATVPVRHHRSTAKKGEPDATLLLMPAWQGEQHIGVKSDIISCPTLTETPLIQGAWLRPRQHLDFVGGFTPTKREADDESARRSQVFVDTRDGALKEASDNVEPIAWGVLAPEAILADLVERSRREEAPARAATAITFFKSVGSALSDLGAAQLVCRSALEITAPAQLRDAQKWTRDYEHRTRTRTGSPSSSKRPPRRRATCLSARPARGTGECGRASSVGPATGQ